MSLPEFLQAIKLASSSSFVLMLAEGEPGRYKRSKSTGPPIISDVPHIPLYAQFDGQSSSI